MFIRLCLLAVVFVGLVPGGLIAGAGSSKSALPEREARKSERRDAKILPLDKVVDVSARQLAPGLSALNVVDVSECPDADFPLSARGNSDLMSDDVDALGGLSPESRAVLKELKKDFHDGTNLRLSRAIDDYNARVREINIKREIIKKGVRKYFSVRSAWGLMTTGVVKFECPAGVAQKEFNDFCAFHEQYSKEVSDCNALGMEIALEQTRQAELRGRLQDGKDRARARARGGKRFICC